MNNPFETSIKDMLTALAQEAIQDKLDEGRGKKRKAIKGGKMVKKKEGQTDAQKSANSGGLSKAKLKIRGKKAAKSKKKKGGQKKILKKRAKSMKKRQRMGLK